LEVKTASLEHPADEVGVVLVAVEMAEIVHRAIDL
jgi:hypothetical protein